MEARREGAGEPQAKAMRWSAATGAVGIVLLMTALFLPGAPPKTSDSVQHLTEAFAGKRRLFLLDAYLAGLGGLAFLWFLAPLREFLASARRGRDYAAVAVASGTSAVLLILVGVALTTGLVLNAARMGDPAVVRALADATNVFVELGKFGLAGLVLAVVAGAAEAGLLGRRPLLLGAAAAALLLLSALPPFLADAGIWQFGGGPEVAAALPALAWLVWLSLGPVRVVPSYPRIARKTRHNCR